MPQHPMGLPNRVREMGLKRLTAQIGAKFGLAINICKITDTLASRALQQAAANCLRESN
jgi:hypothetical protein